MKLSIIIPVYNTGAFLERCVNSIEIPSSVKCEIILVDDGSSDGTSPEICDSLAARDTNIKVLHTTNQGAFEARMRGVKEATGDWVMFMDSDDSLVSGALKGLMSHVGTEADIIIGTLNINNRTVYEHKIQGLVSIEDYLVSLLKFETSIGTVAKLYRKTLFADEIYRPIKKIIVNEDLLLLMTLASRARSVYIDNALVCYNYYFRENTMRTAKMPVPIWDYLFRLIEKIISPYQNDKINDAFIKYRLRLINICMIKRGIIIKPTDSICKNLLEDCRGKVMNKSERETISLINSEYRQRLSYFKTVTVNTIKRYVKILLRK